jgi:cell division protein FtsL
MSNKSSNNLSNREKLLITALFVAALVICFIKLGGLATIEAISHLYLEQAQIRTELERLDAVLASKQELTEGYSETEADRLRGRKLLPSIDQQPSSIGDLEKLINSNYGRVMAMRVNELNSYGDFSAQNISIKIGDLNDFPTDLILQLENYPQLLIIEQFEWQIGDAETGTANLSLSLYYLN